MLKDYNLSRKIDFIAFLHNFYRIKLSINEYYESDFTLVNKGNKYVMEIDSSYYSPRYKDDNPLSKIIGGDIYKWDRETVRDFYERIPSCKCPLKCELIYEVELKRCYEEHKLEIINYYLKGNKERYIIIK